MAIRVMAMPAIATEHSDEPISTLEQKEGHKIEVQPDY